MPTSNIPRSTHLCKCQDHVWKPLTRGYITLASPEDAHFLTGKWRAVPKGRTVYVRLENLYLHRLILDITANLHGDHINGNALDNRRSNLRPATRHENMRNAAPHRDGTSLYHGVSWVKMANYWRAQIYVDGKQKNLGNWTTQEKAALAYDTAARTHFGEFARLNFP